MDSSRPPSPFLFYSQPSSPSPNSHSLPDHHARQQQQEEQQRRHSTIAFPSQSQPHPQPQAQSQSESQSSSPSPHQVRTLRTQRSFQSSSTVISIPSVESELPMYRVRRKSSRIGVGEVTSASAGAGQAREFTAIGIEGGREGDGEGDGGPGRTSSGYWDVLLRDDVDGVRNRSKEPSSAPGPGGDGRFDLLSGGERDRDEGGTGGWARMARTRRSLRGSRSYDTISVSSSFEGEYVRQIGGPSVTRGAGATAGSGRVVLDSSSSSDAAPSPSPSPKVRLGSRARRGGGGYGAKRSGGSVMGDRVDVGLFGSNDNTRVYGDRERDDFDGDDEDGDGDEHDLSDIPFPTTLSLERVLDQSSTYNRSMSSLDVRGMGGAGGGGGVGGGRHDGRTTTSSSSDGTPNRLYLPPRPGAPEPPSPASSRLQPIYLEEHPLPPLPSPSNTNTNPNPNPNPNAAAATSTGSVPTHKQAPSNSSVITSSSNIMRHRHRVDSLPLSWGFPNRTMSHLRTARYLRERGGEGIGNAFEGGGGVVEGGDRDRDREGDGEDVIVRHKPRVSEASTNSSEDIDLDLSMEIGVEIQRFVGRESERMRSRSSKVEDRGQVVDHVGIDIDSSPGSRTHSRSGSRSGYGSGSGLRRRTLSGNVLSGGGGGAGGRFIAGSTCLPPLESEDDAGSSGSHHHDRFERKPLTLGSDRPGGDPIVVQHVRPLGIGVGSRSATNATMGLAERRNQKRPEWITRGDDELRPYARPPTSSGPVHGPGSDSPSAGDLGNYSSYDEVVGPLGFSFNRTAPISSSPPPLPPHVPPPTPTGTIDSATATASSGGTETGREERRRTSSFPIRAILDKAMRAASSSPLASSPTSWSPFSSPTWTAFGSPTTATTDVTSIGMDRRGSDFSSALGSPPLPKSPVSAAPMSNRASQSTVGSSNRNDRLSATITGGHAVIGGPGGMSMGLGGGVSAPVGSSYGSSLGRRVSEIMMGTPDLADSSDLGTSPRETDLPTPRSPEFDLGGNGEGGWDCGKSGAFGGGVRSREFGRGDADGDVDVIRVGDESRRQERTPSPPTEVLYQDVRAEDDDVRHPPLSAPPFTNMRRTSAGGAGPFFHSHFGGGRRRMSGREELLKTLMEPLVAGIANQMPMRTTSGSQSSRISGLGLEGVELIASPSGDLPSSSAEQSYTTARSYSYSFDGVFGNRSNFNTSGGGRRSVKSLSPAGSIPVLSVSSPEEVEAQTFAGNNNSNVFYGSPQSSPTLAAGERAQLPSGDHRPRMSIDTNATGEAESSEEARPRKLFTSQHQARQIGHRRSSTSSRLRELWLESKASSKLLKSNQSPRPGNKLKTSRQPTTPKLSSHPDGVFAAWVGNMMEDVPSAKALFLLGFLMGPWCWVIAGWGLGKDGTGWWWKRPDRPCRCFDEVHGEMGEGHTSDWHLRSGQSKGKGKGKGRQEGDAMDEKSAFEDDDDHADGARMKVGIMDILSPSKLSPSKSSTIGSKSFPKESVSLANDLQSDLGQDARAHEHHPRCPIRAKAGEHTIGQRLDGWVAASRTASYVSSSVVLGVTVAALVAASKG